MWVPETCRRLWALREALFDGRDSSSNGFTAEGDMVLFQVCGRKFENDEVGELADDRQRGYHRALYVEASSYDN
jgi:hypothetical protein